MRPAGVEPVIIPVRGIGRSSRWGVAWLPHLIIERSYNLLRRNRITGGEGLLDRFIQERLLPLPEIIVRSPLARSAVRRLVA